MLRYSQFRTLTLLDDNVLYRSKPGWVLISPVIRIAQVRHGHFLRLRYRENAPPDPFAALFGTGIAMSSCRRSLPTALSSLPRPVLWRGLPWRRSAGRHAGI